MAWWRRVGGRGRDSWAGGESAGGNLDLGKLIEALGVQIEEAEGLKAKRYDCPELKAWKAKTRSLIRGTSEPDFPEQFEGLSFWSRVSFAYESDEEEFARNESVYTADLRVAQG